MHVIRLREPWKRTRAEQKDSDSARSLIYSRTFHRPTGAEQQSIRLRVALHASDDLQTPLTVRLNGAELPVAERGQNELYFELTELLPFNQLELQMPYESDVESLPTFGTFGVHAVEMQIR